MTPFLCSGQRSQICHIQLTWPQFEALVLLLRRNVFLVNLLLEIRDNDVRRDSGTLLGLSKNTR